MAIFNAFEDQAAAIFTRQGDCVFLSENWEQLTGLSLDECIGEGLFLQIHEDFRPRLYEQLAGLTRAKEKKLFKCQIRHADGKWHWYEICLRASKAEAGRYLCLMRNITKNVQARKSLEKARLEGELALKGRSEFLANMSHDLRTPLNAIIGFSEIMESQMFGKITNKKYLDYIANIQESGHTLLAKINDLLELANIDTGRVTMNEECVDINELLRATIKIYAPHALSMHVTLEEALFKAPVMVQIDRVKMKQSLSHILGNALAYNKEGGTVHVACKLLPGGDLAIVITDNGRGIAAAQLRNIHDALAREDSFFARDMNSIGLGLALAKEFIALHQGEIEIESRADVGSKVTVTLPKERIISATTSEVTKPRRRVAV